MTAMDTRTPTSPTSPTSPPSRRRTARAAPRVAPGLVRAPGVAAAVAAALLAGCSSDQVPTDAVMSLSPEERSIRITEFRDADGLCRTDGSRFVDVPMLLRLATRDGSPIEGAEAEVYVDFAANTYSGHPVLALYEDRNGNGVVDADSELASGAGDSIARVRTGDDGTYRMLLRADIACPYRGEVFAYAGAATAQASFEVTAEETIEPEPPQTPEPGRTSPRLPDDRDAEDGAEDDVERDVDDDVDPFETVPDGGGSDGTAPDDEADGSDGPAEGEDADADAELDAEVDVDAEVDGAAGDTTDADADGPEPRPVHCTDGSGRRTAVVCTVGPEAAS